MSCFQLNNWHECMWSATEAELVHIYETRLAGLQPNCFYMLSSHFSSTWFFNTLAIAAPRFTLLNIFFSLDKQLTIFQFQCKSSLVSITWDPESGFLHYTVISTILRTLILDTVVYGQRVDVSGSSNCSAGSVARPSAAGFHLYPLKYSSPLISLFHPFKGFFCICAVWIKALFLDSTYHFVFYTRQNLVTNARSGKTPSRLTSEWKISARAKRLLMLETRQRKNTNRMLPQP